MYSFKIPVQCNTESSSSSHLEQLLISSFIDLDPCVSLNLVYLLIRETKTWCKSVLDSAQYSRTARFYLRRACCRVTFRSQQRLWHRLDVSVGSEHSRHRPWFSHQMNLRSSKSKRMLGRIFSPTGSVVQMPERARSNKTTEHPSPDSTQRATCSSKQGTLQYRSIRIAPHPEAQSCARMQSD